MKSTIKSPINVYIEIEKGSNFKYEFNKQTNQLELDRILTDPHVYPYAYGFIPNTLAEDGDELDVLVISENAMPIKNDTFIDVCIVGALLMEDEHGNDHKILAIPETEYETGNIQSLYDMPSDTLESIQTFFANYKKNELDKWSIVSGFVGKPAAIQIYEKSLLSLSFDGKPSPDNPVGVPRRQPDTPASQANPRTPTLVPRSGVLTTTSNAFLDNEEVEREGEYVAKNDEQYAHTSSH